MEEKPITSRYAAVKHQKKLDRQNRVSPEQRKLNADARIASGSAFGLGRKKSADVRHHDLIDAKTREESRGRKAEHRLILANGPEFPQSEWLERVREWGGACLRCGTDVDLTIDHIIPVHLGGTDAIENLQLLCRSCNSSKGTKKDDYRPPKT